MRFLVTLLAIAGMLSLPSPIHAASDSMIYGVYHSLNMGNPGEKSEKDFYVNIGAKNGVKEGSILEVIRKVPTYDLVSKTLYKEMLVPIATLKVIHVEANVAVARVKEMLPLTSTPVLNPHAVIVGDYVRMK